MVFPKKKVTDTKLTILIAPLDWGLGHATRCIPVVKKLQQLSVNVIIAVEDETKSLLQQEFPTIEFLSLHGYKIKYSKIE